MDLLLYSSRQPHNIHRIAAQEHAEQRLYAQARSSYGLLQTPSEAVYPVGDADSARRLGLDD